MKRKKVYKIILPLIAILIVLPVGLWIFYAGQSYDDIEIQTFYEEPASENGNYIAFGEGILRYSRDGIVFYDYEGKELWNYPCQLQTPMVEMCENSAVLGDKDGTSILVINNEGIKGEFQTSRPIERLAISTQGIVAAVLKDETTPQIVCYDARGDVLVQQKASLANTGYPIDIAISKDGKMLMVAYLCTGENAVSTQITCYNFGEENQKSGEYEVASKSYENQMIPSIEFLDEESSILIGNNSIYIWEGKEAPKEVLHIPVEGEIEKVAYDETYIALVLNIDGDQSLHFMKRNGKEKFVHPMRLEYSKMKIAEKEVLMYEGNKCLIISAGGIVKYEGKVEQNIGDIIPVYGLSKYIIVGNSGLQQIQLTK